MEPLAVNPYLIAKDAAENPGVAFTTAQRAIAKLERLGIVKQPGKAKRDRLDGVYIKTSQFQERCSHASAAPMKILPGFESLLSLRGAGLDGKIWRLE